MASLSLSRRAHLALAAVSLSMPFALRAQEKTQDPAEVLVKTAPSLEALRKNFLTPPAAAKPMVRWWWFGPAVTNEEVSRELHQMVADGIGGAEMAFVYPEELDDPAKGIKNLEFLSPAMLDVVHYAQEEGRRLGLRIDVTLCSGWPYGGPAIPLAQAVTRLRTAEVPVSAGATSVEMPALGEGESLVSAVLAKPAGNAAGVTPEGRGRRGPRPPSFVGEGAEPLNVEGGKASFGAGQEPRVAVFFILSHTKQQVKRAAVGAEGYVLDPFSHDAVATHLRAVGEPLVKAFGTTPPYAIFSDSLEAYGADWTPKLPEEFRRRRGYDLIPHLAELVAGGTPEAAQVRHDYGQTLTELVNENYLVQINNWAKEHNTKFRSQTYGEPAVDFSSQNLVALAEGEGPQWRAFSTLRWATSANHVFGHDVTSGETYTWLHSPVFRAIPLDMKAEADIDFIMGENQLIFHGWPYSPPQAFYPGWSLYAAANFNDNNPWHPVMPEVTQYLARLSYLMRQGEPANQVALLLPTDDVWATFSPMHTTVTGALVPHVTPLMAPILNAGYNVDYIDAKAIDTTGLGTHQVLVIPATDRIPVDTLRKITAWAQQGGKVIAVGKLPTMTPEGKPLTGVDTSAIPVIKDESMLGQALHNAVAPDFRLGDGDEVAETQLGFIRRKLPYADVYFVANTSNEPMDATVTFGTDHKSGQAWAPDAGTVEAATAEGEKIHLAPYESRVFVFGGFSGGMRASQGVSGMGAEAADLKPVADLSTDWKVDFVGEHKVENEATLKDWLDDPATKNYSGEAVYSKEFDLKAKPAGPVYLEVEGGSPVAGAPNRPPEHVLGLNGLPDPNVTRPGPGMRAYYDPPVRAAALVTINGQAAGALWHPPYRLDVAKYLKPGQNRIEIKVYNTALNHWASLPPHNFGPLIAKYGDRFQMQDLNKVEPVPSGLLGKVYLVTAPK